VLSAFQWPLSPSSQESVSACNGVYSIVFVAIVTIGTVVAGRLVVFIVVTFGYGFLLS
jgi:hypothetical protein